MTEAEIRRIPIQPGFFTIPDESPRLLGSQCPACGESFFPRREVCAACLADSLEPVELGPSGTLYTFTWVHLPLFDTFDAPTLGRPSVEAEKRPLLGPSQG